MRPIADSIHTVSDMNPDLSEILSEWPYQPGRLNVRLIKGKNQDPKIQIRLDLGILQMEVEGRPDGHQPFGYGSLLEYYEARADGAEPPPDEVDAEEPFSLDERDVRALREEAAQYYHRYMALLALEDYEGVVRDATRNLRVLDFVREHATNEALIQELEPFRPYIMMVRARAMASQSLRDNEPKAAVVAIEQGIEALRQHFDKTGHPELFEQSNEVAMLRDMRESLLPKLPVSQRAELRQRLQSALEQENYELAAILRDELRNLGEDQPGRAPRTDGGQI